MSTFATAVGLAAAVCPTQPTCRSSRKRGLPARPTTLPQDALAVRLRPRAVGGVCILEEDIVIILANGISLAVLAALLVLKVLQAHS